MKTFLLLLFAALACGAARAADPSCHVQPFAIVAQDGGYGIDNSRDTFHLAEQAAQAYAGDMTLGLTAVQSVIEVQLNDLDEPGGQRACDRPRVEVFLRYAPMKVYIAREFPPDTCPYKTILAHEMRHLTAYREHLPAVESAVRAFLMRRFAGAEQPDTAALEAEIDGTWIPYIRAEFGKIDLPQRLIDSPEEKGRLSRACLGALASRLGNLYSLTGAAD